MLWFERRINRNHAALVLSRPLDNLNWDTLVDHLSGLDDMLLTTSLLGFTVTAAAARACASATATAAASLSVSQGTSRELTGLSSTAAAPIKALQFLLLVSLEIASTSSIITAAAARDTSAVATAAASLSVSQGTSRELTGLSSTATTAITARYSFLVDRNRASLSSTTATATAAGFSTAATTTAAAAPITA